VKGCLVDADVSLGGLDLPSYELLGASYVDPVLANHGSDMRSVSTDDRICVTSDGCSVGSLGSQKM
jgi:hypothetical protein